MQRRFLARGRFRSLKDCARRFERMTGEILREIGPADGVFGASDLDFDATGTTLYWNNFLTGEVYKHDLLTGVSTQLAALHGIVDSMALNHQVGTPGPIVVRQKFGLDVVYVSDTFSLRKLLGLTGTTLDQTLVSPLPTELSLVQSLWDDGTHFITTSFITNLVQVWDPVTKHVVMASQTFQVPMNAIRFQGELAVAELGSGQVVRGSDRLPYIANLTIPTGLAATAEDLYVADFATGTIYQAAKDGVIQHPPVIVAQHLVAPEGMAIDNDGHLLVAETGRQRLVRIDPVTYHLDVIADDLALGFPAIVGWPPTGQVLTGVAVSPSGTIYVAGDVDNVVYRIQKTH